MKYSCAYVKAEKNAYSTPFRILLNKCFSVFRISVYLSITCNGCEYS